MSDAWHEYKLVLQPRDFFLFASGFGDSDADITPVKESVIRWKEGEKATVANNVVLVPATSIKGAISHRTAFHWNKENKLYIGNQDARTCEENEAVKALFGYQNDNDIKRGNVLFSDMFLSDDSLSDKVQHHVKIDRFTGGAISGALYQEKVVYGPESILKTTIYVSRSVPEEYIKSFEAALRDVASGMLPLGGAVNRGHGIFTGSVEKNGEPLN
jgi:CRISPR/Cas system CSM-associated protein Csm3 (group 7 of RAMP superfamily)